MSSDDKTVERIVRIKLLEATLARIRRHSLELRKRADVAQENYLQRVNGRCPDAMELRDQADAIDALLDEDDIDQGPEETA